MSEKRQHKGRITVSHFHDVNAKVKILIRKTGQPVKCKVSPFLADISELPSIGWGCIHEEDAAMEYKCPKTVTGMLISEVWNKVEYLEIHEGKKASKGHRYCT